MAITSLVRWATEATASLASRTTRRRSSVGRHGSKLAGRREREADAFASIGGDGQTSARRRYRKGLRTVVGAALAAAPSEVTDAADAAT